jgi:hypothetical protein
VPLLLEPVAAAPDQHQPLRAAARDHQPAAVRELLGERRRRPAGAAGPDVDRVVRRALRIAARPVADDERDVPHARLRERGARTLRQRRVPLDRDDPRREVGEHRRVVAGAGPDVEHVLVAAQREQLAHARDHVGLRDRLARGDRQRRVLPRLGAQVGRDEHVARDRGHRREHALVAHAAREQADEMRLVHRQMATRAHAG